MNKKRLLKLAGIIVLLVGIITLAVLNVWRTSHPSSGPQTASLLSPTPAVLESWIPTDGTPVDDSRVPPNTILIKDFSFHPQQLVVKAGVPVKIINADAAEHSLSSDSKLFDTGILGQKETGTLTFPMPGTYPYHCRRHSAMQGSIQVAP